MKLDNERQAACGRRSNDWKQREDAEGQEACGREETLITRQKLIFNLYDCCDGELHRWAAGGLQVGCTSACCFLSPGVNVQDLRSNNEYVRRAKIADDNETMFPDQQR